VEDEEPQKEEEEPQEEDVEPPHPPQYTYQSGMSNNGGG
jgi:hypothetical protein